MNMNDEVKLKKAHNVVIQSRRQMSLTGVIKVENFNDKIIVLDTDMGQMTIEGDNLHINKLLLESGDLNIDGNISGIFYSDIVNNGEGKKQNGFFSKLLK